VLVYQQRQNYWQFLQTKKKRNGRNGYYYYVLNMENKIDMIFVGKYMNG
jgi:hypothetical protein